MKKIRRKFKNSKIKIRGDKLLTFVASIWHNDSEQKLKELRWLHLFTVKKLYFIFKKPPKLKCQKFHLILGFVSWNQEYGTMKGCLSLCIKIDKQVANRKQHAR